MIRVVIVTARDGSRASRSADESIIASWDGWFPSDERDDGLFGEDGRSV
jgi:hypothetical protein|tara:strand:- start:1191 stop:1337 length:147 start_codon:yes stop_codon:yes gene_type:complete